MVRQETVPAEGRSHRTVTLLEILHPNVFWKTSKNDNPNGTADPGTQNATLPEAPEIHRTVGIFAILIERDQNVKFFNNFEKQGAQRLGRILGPPRDGPGRGSIPPYRYASWNFASERFLKKNIKKWESERYGWSPDPKRDSPGGSRNPIYR